MIIFVGGLYAGYINGLKLFGKWQIYMIPTDDNKEMLAVFEKSVDFTFKNNILELLEYAKNILQNLLYWNLRKDYALYKKNIRNKFVCKRIEDK